MIPLAGGSVCAVEERGVLRQTGHTVTLYSAAYTSVSSAHPSEPQFPYLYNVVVSGTQLTVILGTSS